MMGYKLCPDCKCPILKKGQKRKHPDDYRHAQGCRYARGKYYARVQRMMDRPNPNWVDPHPEIILKKRELKAMPLSTKKALAEVAKAVQHVCGTFKLSRDGKIRWTVLDLEAAARAGCLAYFEPAIANWENWEESRKADWRRVVFAVLKSLSICPSNPKGKRTS